MVRTTQVRLEGVTKQFGATQIVRGIDLSIGRGEIIALLGPSGCGKTTLLRCIAGLEEPTAGAISIGDRLVYSAEKGINESSERRKIGLVFQSYALWPHMTVAENVAYGLHIKKVGKSEIASRVTKILATVGLSGLADRFPSTLSGGQQQRVALARSLVVEADVILFDEPLSNLDLKLREEMRLELRRLITRLGVTAIFVTHDQSEAMVLADRICLMHAGKLIQEGAPRDVYNRPLVRFAMDFLGSSNFVQGNYVAERTIKLPSNHTLETHDRQGTATLVGIRPEHIRICADGECGANIVPGEIVDAFFLGHTTTCLVDAGGLQWQVSSTDPTHVKGMRVSLFFPPHCLLSLHE